MDYPKLVEMIPAEKWAPLSSKLIGVILNSKKDALPNTLANAMLLKIKEGNAETKDGIAVILQAAITLDAEKTVTALGDMQLLKIAEQVVQAM
ncbi:MAG: hypothetical protein GX638_09995 [Crenarchaeota archaeon]|nr:hypothetical protein [Thermoproteota archaeon]